MRRALGTNKMGRPSKKVDKVTDNRYTTMLYTDFFNGGRHSRSSYVDLFAISVG